MIYIQLFLSFIQVGMFSIGGGMQPGVNPEPGRAGTRLADDE